MTARMKISTVAVVVACILLFGTKDQSDGSIWNVLSSVASKVWDFIVGSAPRIAGEYVKQSRERRENCDFQTLKKLSDEIQKSLNDIADRSSGENQVAYLQVIADLENMWDTKLLELNQLFNKTTQITTEELTRSLNNLRNVSFDNRLLLNNMMKSMENSIQTVEERISRNSAELKQHIRVVVFSTAKNLSHLASRVDAIDLSTTSLLLHFENLRFLLLTLTLAVFVKMFIDYLPTLLNLKIVFIRRQRQTLSDREWALSMAKICVSILSFECAFLCFLSLCMEFRGTFCVYVLVSGTFVLMLPIYMYACMGPGVALDVKDSESSDAGNTNSRKKKSERKSKCKNRSLEYEIGRQQQRKL